MPAFIKNNIMTAALCLLMLSGAAAEKRKLSDWYAERSKLLGIPEQVFLTEAEERSRGDQFTLSGAKGSKHYLHLGYAMDAIGPDDQLLIGPGWYSPSFGYLNFTSSHLVRGAGRDRTWLMCGIACQETLDLVVEGITFDAAKCQKALDLDCGGNITFRDCRFITSNNSLYVGNYKGARVLFEDCEFLSRSSENDKFNHPQRTPDRVSAKLCVEPVFFAKEAVKPYGRTVFRRCVFSEVTPVLTYYRNKEFPAGRSVMVKEGDFLRLEDCVMIDPQVPAPASEMLIMNEGNKRYPSDYKPYVSKSELVPAGGYVFVENMKDSLWAPLASARNCLVVYGGIKQPKKEDTRTGPVAANLLPASSWKLMEKTVVVAEPGPSLGLTDGRFGQSAAFLAPGGNVMVRPEALASLAGSWDGSFDLAEALSRANRVHLLARSPKWNCGEIVSEEKMWAAIIEKASRARASGDRAGACALLGRVLKAKPGHSQARKMVRDIYPGLEAETRARAEGLHAAGQHALAALEMIKLTAIAGPAGLPAPGYAGEVARLGPIGRRLEIAAGDFWDTYLDAFNGSSRGILERVWREAMSYQYPGALHYGDSLYPGTVTSLKVSGASGSYKPDVCMIARDVRQMDKNTKVWETPASGELADLVPMIKAKENELAAAYGHADESRPEYTEYSVDLRGLRGNAYSDAVGAALRQGMPADMLKVGADGRTLSQGSWRTLTKGNQDAYNQACDRIRKLQDELERLKYQAGPKVVNYQTKVTVPVEIWCEEAAVSYKFDLTAVRPGSDSLPLYRGIEISSRYRGKEDLAWEAVEGVDNSCRSVQVYANSTYLQRDAKASLAGLIVRMISAEYDNLALKWKKESLADNEQGKESRAALLLAQATPQEIGQAFINGNDQAVWELARRRQERLPAERAASK